MEKTEKPKSSWRERKKEIKQKWLSPFIYIEWLCERLSYRLGRWAFLDILGHLGRLAIIVAVISYFMGAEERRKVKHYQAWQVINAAQGKPGSGGRIDALQDLNKENIFLAGVDLSNAYLLGIDLKNARLFRAKLAGAELTVANLSGAELSSADLSGAYLGKADLSGTYLRDANLSEATLGAANLSGAKLYNADLSGANLVKADLSGANLSNANLSEAFLIQTDINGIQGWEDVKSIEGAKIYGVKNPPEGFIKWAKDHGAKIIESKEELGALLKKRSGARKTN